MISYPRYKVIIICLTTIFLGGELEKGVTAFYALKNHSDRLNSVFAQSAVFEMDSLAIIKELQNTDLGDIKIYYNFGTFEGKDSSYSQMGRFLKSKIANYGFNYYNEGKANFSLKGHLDDALIYILGKD